MPITTKQMATDVAIVPEFAWGSGTVNVKYSPSGLTEETLDKMTVIMDPTSTSLSANTQAMNSALAAVVVDWDVYEDDGVTVVPRDQEHLRELPILFRAEVLKRILEAFAPNETGATETPSAPSSDTTKASATAQP